MKNKFLLENINNDHRYFCFKIEESDESYEKKKRSFVSKVIYHRNIHDFRSFKLDINVQGGCFARPAVICLKWRWTIRRMVFRKFWKTKTFGWWL